MQLSRLVPKEVNGWSAEAGGQEHDRTTLFDYIDGGAELYLAYGFREMLACRFHREGHPDIVVDLFDMGSSEDAFGVFTAERHDPDAGIGQGSEYGAGLLRFWKGRFFVSVWTERETPETTSGVTAIGRQLAQAIKQSGHPPQLLELLPKQSLVDTAVKYFHNQPSLNLHYFVADDNILGLSDRTEAVLAPYGTADGLARLLLVRYETTDAAQKALGTFLAAYLPEAGDAGMAQVESGTWVAAASRADVVAVVFDAPSCEHAEELLNAVRKIMEEQPT